MTPEEELTRTVEIIEERHDKHLVVLILVDEDGRIGISANAPPHIVAQAMMSASSNFEAAYFPVAGNA